MQVVKPDFLGWIFLRVAFLAGFSGGLFWWFFLW